MDFPLVVACLTLAILVVQATIYGFQLRQMRRSTDAATKAAIAAKDSVELAKDTTAKTQRAFVMIDTVVVTRRGEAFGLDNSSVVIFTLRNFGQTIARSVELSGKLFGSVGRCPLEKSPARAIAPQATNEWVSPKIGDWIDDELIKSINGFTSTLQYEINVTYTDVFYECPHRYNCAGRYAPDVKKFIVTSSTSD